MQHLMPGLIGFAVAAALLPLTVQAATSSWMRWEHELISTADHANPYADVTVTVTYKDAQGKTATGQAFWDGGRSFKLRFMFPRPGRWTWRTECSDPENQGLHGREGAVQVEPYVGENPLYRHGYLKVSESRRYLAHFDGKPFLWIGDTSWLAHVRATDAEWREFVDDRSRRKFSVIVISCCVSGGESDKVDVKGNAPFMEDGIGRWNPVFWRNFDSKVQYANDRGLVVTVTGLAWGRMIGAPLDDVKRFARLLSARLAGNFVVLSPKQDWSGDRPDEDLRVLETEIKEAAPHILVTEHPKRRPMPELAIGYHRHRSLDFASVQTGIGPDADGTAVDLAKASKATVEWTTALYKTVPTKPIITLEGAYDDDYKIADPAYQTLARRGGYMSFLCGAYGFTSSTYGIWAWGRPAFRNTRTPPDLKTAMARPYATYLQHLAAFFEKVEWWRLEPRHDLILNQPEDWGKRMLLAKTESGDLFVAYVPDNERINIQVTEGTRIARGEWWNPSRGESQPAQGRVTSASALEFSKPSGWEDALLILRSRNQKGVDK